MPLILRITYFPKFSRATNKKKKTRLPVVIFINTSQKFLKSFVLNLISAMSWFLHCELTSFFCCLLICLNLSDCIQSLHNRLNLIFQFQFPHSNLVMYYFGHWPRLCKKLSKLQILGFEIIFLFQKSAQSFCFCFYVLKYEISK